MPAVLVQQLLHTGKVEVESEVHRVLPVRVLQPHLSPRLTSVLQEQLQRIVIIRLHGDMHGGG